MKISFDQAITATGIVAFHDRGLSYVTITPKPKLKGHYKQRDMVEQILLWLEDLQAMYPKDIITHIALEDFVAYIPEDRKASMMKLHRFTGYLRGHLENWGHGKIEIIEVGKGNTPKTSCQMLAKRMGFKYEDEHQADAFYQGVLAGFI